MCLKGPCIVLLNSCVGRELVEGFLGKPVNEASV